MSLGGTKDEHFSCFHSSSQLGLRGLLHIFREYLLDIPEASLTLTHRGNHEFEAQFIIEASAYSYRSLAFYNMMEMKELSVTNASEIQQLNSEEGNEDLDNLRIDLLRKRIEEQEKSGQKSDFCCCTTVDWCD